MAVASKRPIAVAGASDSEASARQTPQALRNRRRPVDRTAPWRWGGPLLLVLAPLVLPLVAALPARAASTEALIKLLERRACAGCKLQDADLVQADLRDADLRRAQLQRANLSGSRLDGARLSGADLSFTSLQGASLRGADLRGARLEGTDLRESDLSGALLDAGALARAHWQAAKGIQAGGLSYAQLHNAGVEASLAGNPPEAERLFGQAISQQPEAALSWLARGIARSDQGKTDLAAADFRYAASLYAQQGEMETAKKLTEAATLLEKPAPKGPGGNGQGMRLMSGAAGLFQTLAPLAIKFLTAF